MNEVEEPAVFAWGQPASAVHRAKLGNRAQTWKERRFSAAYDIEKGKEPQPPIAASTLGSTALSSPSNFPFTRSPVSITSA
jgi:hypothetical protein